MEQEQDTQQQGSIKQIQKTDQGSKYPTKLILNNVYKNYSDKDVYNFVQKYAPNKQELFKLLHIYKERQKSATVIEFQSVQERNRFVSIFNSPENQEKMKKEHYIRIFDESHDYEMACMLYPQKGKRIESILKGSSVKKQVEYKKPKQEFIDQENKKPIQHYVCPFFDIKYEKQVEKKKSDLKKVITNWKNQGFKVIGDNKDPPEWLIDNQLPKVGKFVSAEEEHRQKYRNQVNFSCGRDLEGIVRVGYPKGDIGKFTGHTVNGKNINTLPQICIEIGNILEFFLQNLEKTVKNNESNSDAESYEQMKLLGKIFDKYQNSGFWKKFVVRQSFQTKEILINAVVFQNNSDSDDQDLKNFNIVLEQAKKLLIDQLVSDNTNKILLDLGYKIVSINIQVTDKYCDKIQTEEPVENIWGSQDFYTENILDKKYQVNSNSYLISHTQQNEKLVQQIQNIINLDENTTLIDLCSGIGILGVQFAQQCKNVVSIEIEDQQVICAKQNYELNNIKNQEVICAKIEDMIRQKLEEIVEQNKQIENHKITCILDPPRTGINKLVVQHLRKCEQIKQIIYISSSPQSVIDNLNYLCLPESNRRQGKLLQPDQCFQIDIYPLTENYLTIFELNRQQNQDENEL